MSGEEAAHTQYGAHRSARAMQRRSPLDVDRFRQAAARLCAKDKERCAPGTGGASDRAEELRLAYERKMEAVNVDEWVERISVLCQEIPYLLLRDKGAYFTEECPEQMFPRVLEWWRCGKSRARYDEVVKKIRNSTFSKEAERVLVYWRLHHDQLPLREFARGKEDAQPLWLLDGLRGVIQGKSGMWPFLEEEIDGAVERMQAYSVKLRELDMARRAKEKADAEALQATRNLMPPPPRVPRRKLAENE